MSKPEFTLEVYDKLIEMMRSSNPEDFFMGIEIYKHHNKSHIIDMLMIKSFGGSKRADFIEAIGFDAIKYNRHIMLDEIKKTIDEYMLETECKIFKRLEDEYNSY